MPPDILDYLVQAQKVVFVLLASRLHQGSAVEPSPPQLSRVTRNLEGVGLLPSEELFSCHLQVTLWSSATEVQCQACPREGSSIRWTRPVLERAP